MEQHNATAIGRAPMPGKPRHAMHGLAILLPAILAGFAMTTTNSEFGDIIFAAIADAYIQVSTFVAGTFFIFYGIEKFLKIDATAAL